MKTTTPKCILSDESYVELVKVVGIYFVIGYGRDCDGSESFNCTAFIDKHFAEAYCDSCRHGSDGIQYDMTSDMTHVYEYCSAWNRPIPLAYGQQKS